MSIVWKLVLTMVMVLSTTGCVSVVETPDDLIVLELHAPPPGQSPGWMHVVLGSKFDFEKYTINNNNIVSLDTCFCNKKVPEYLLVEMLVFSNGDGYAIDVDKKYSAKMMGGYFRYDVFINAIRRKRSHSGLGAEPNELDEINFLTAPEDVCLNFRSYSGFLVTLSNVVLIPKERLAEEMAHPTPGGKRLDPLKGDIVN